MMTVVTLLAAGTAGVLARRFGLPGGAIVGALLVTAALSLTFGDVVVARPVRLVLFVGVGTMIGTLVTRRTLREIPAVAVQAVAAAVMIIGAGIAIALLLRVLDIAPLGDVLATSPGALSVLSAVALENDLDAPTVALFHIVRIVLILLTLPLLVALLPDATRPGYVREPGSADRAAAGRRVPSHRDVLQLTLTAGGAAGGALVAVRLGIDGGLVIGTTVGAAAVTLASARGVYRPIWLTVGIQCGLGWLIGTLVTEETALALRGALGAAVLASALLIVAGIGTALLLRTTGFAPPGDVLATSPGAIEALASVADEHDAGAVQVALFHTIRLVLVILSLPLLLALLP